MFDRDFLTPLSKESKKKPKSSPSVSEVTKVFATMIEMFDRLEAKVDRFEARFSLLEDSHQQ